VLLLIVAGAALWLFGPALLPPENIDAGIAKGEQAPIAMSLRDPTGKPTTLAEQMGEKGMVLLLVRSADWCPFCKAQLARSEQIREALEADGYALASLSYDEPPILAAFAAENELGFVMLSDKGSKMIDALDLRDPQYEEGSYAWGVPYASILVLAPDGTVLTKFVSEDYRSRLSNEDVKAMVKRVAD
jgi:peroxiredoxin